MKLFNLTIKIIDKKKVGVMTGRDEVRLKVYSYISLL